MNAAFVCAWSGAVTRLGIAIRPSALADTFVDRLSAASGCRVAEGPRPAMRGMVRQSRRGAFAVLISQFPASGRVATEGERSTPEVGLTRRPAPVCETHAGAISTAGRFHDYGSHARRLFFRRHGTALSQSRRTILRFFPNSGYETRPQRPRRLRRLRRSSTPN